MADSATPTRTDHVRPHSEGDRELARALALLQGDRAGPVTIAALRERGVKAPAQAVYELQLAGYEIDRVPCRCSDGHTTQGYRLRAASALAADRSPRVKEVDGDEV